MAVRQLPDDFRDFLNLLNRNDVKYLLVGGWASEPDQPGDAPKWVLDFSTDGNIVRATLSHVRGFVDKTPLDHLLLIDDHLEFSFRSAKSGPFMRAKGHLQGDTLSMDLCGIEDSHIRLELKRQTPP